MIAGLNDSKLPTCIQVLIVTVSNQTLDPLFVSIMVVLCITLDPPLYWTATGRNGIPESPTTLNRTFYTSRTERPIITVFTGVSFCSQGRGDWQTPPPRQTPPTLRRHPPGQVWWLRGGLYSGVQCIMGSGHLRPDTTPSMNRQKLVKTSPSPNFLCGR